MRVLHIANGHCTTELIEASGVPGRTMVWADALVDGPVPDVPDDELVRVRAAFLAGRPEDAGEVAANLAQWRTALADHDSYDELVLWFEHDLFDQLNLIQLLTHLGARPSPKPLTMVSIDAFPGHPYFQGLGQLTPADLSGLFGSRRPITPGQLALASRAWRAFRSPDPRAIEAVLATDTSPLPFLAAALARHLEEFPSDINGLSRSERQIMDQAIDAPVEIRDAFPRTQSGETAYFITDTSFFDLANALASSSPPLLTIHLSQPKGSAMPVGTIELTKQGLEVVHGRSDRLKVTGIDRWLGGVHLTGHGPAWRWSARDRQLIEA